MENILGHINSPADLKILSLPQLSQLAEEIRERLIETVSETGGHLASNLGVVELTLALHYIFDSPKDKIIWDVGHQSYVHKLLTGRQELLEDLRQDGGIAGFPRREESPHDIFNTGHGSTSISAALGLAQARDLKGSDENIIAVIGDGALTGGMALEALNQASHLTENLIVILNDNQMSIARNVGAMASYLSKIRFDPRYLKAKQDFEQAMEFLPHGKSIVETVDRFKGSLKSLLVPGMLFEEFGFKYLGPIDGHNLEVLRNTLEKARGAKGRVLIHIVTHKGQGYAPAEEDPTRFHGTPPFDVESGLVEPAAPGTAPTYTRVFGDTLCKLASENPKIVAISAAMRDGTGLLKFSREFPKRFYDVGMAEQHAVTFAAGLAVGGYHPVVAIYSTFFQRAYDQILHDVCMQNLPVVLALDRAGIVGEDGPTHQGIFDLSFLRHIPNLTVMAPKDENELRQMLVTAFNQPGPCAIRYPRGKGLGVSLQSELEEVPCGKAEILRKGKDAFILAIGTMVYPALKAAEQLAFQGLDVGVINARFVKPLDSELIQSIAEKVPYLLTVEENVAQGGFGSAVLELLQFQNVQTKCLGFPDHFIEHAPRNILLKRYGLDIDGIVSSVLTLFKNPSQNNPILLDVPLQAPGKII